jgi:hypothetical protein
MEDHVRWFSNAEESDELVDMPEEDEGGKEYSEEAGRLEDELEPMPTEDEESDEFEVVRAKKSRMRPSDASSSRSNAKI